MNMRIFVRVSITLCTHFPLTSSKSRYSWWNLVVFRSLGLVPDFYKLFEYFLLTVDYYVKKLFPRGNLN